MPRVSKIYYVLLQDTSIFALNFTFCCLFQLDEEKLDERAKMSVAAKRSLFRVRHPAFYFILFFIFLIRNVM